MIIGWIIQPQIDKLSEQRKQLDSLRVDLKVQSLIAKREILQKQCIRAQIEFERFVKAIKALSELFYHFKRQAYPKGGYQSINPHPVIGLNPGEYIQSLKKININGNN